MKKFLFIILMAAAGVANAENIAYFNDQGATYNLLEYVKTIETGEGTYAIEFKNEEESYYTNFIVTSEGVVAFDPLSDSAALAYSRIIKKIAPNKPLLAIIYSHLHTDHIAGARILRQHFGKHVPIIAHERVLSYFENNNSPFIDLPTETVTDKGRIYTFGNRTINLRYLGDAHTASMLVPVIPELRMAYICDFANNDVVGWTDLPGIDIDEMLKMQHRVLALDVDKITFCHGQPGTVAAVKRQIEYFEAVLKAATKALDKNLTEDQAAELIELSQYSYFSNYNDWFKDNVRAMYRWAKSKKTK